MSDNRTEKPTPKRREDARRKGQIARRPELSAAVGFLSALVMLRVFGAEFVARAGQLFRGGMSEAVVGGELTPEHLHVMLIEAALNIMALAAPVTLVALAAGVAGNFAQGGLTLTPEALRPKTERFNPVANFKRAFGSNGPIELLKSLLKLCGLGAVCYTVFTQSIADAPTLVGASAPSALAAVGQAGYDLGLRAGATLFFIAGLDYFYGWHKHEKSLRMTKQEVRDEYRQQEGDPLLKGQRRSRARALTRRRLAVEVPLADVVVTNPTHFAVALRYDRERGAAPMVVAKGADHTALRIREIAAAHGVAIIENPPLARTLFRTVEAGRAIPPDLFRAVAELLAYVYRQRAAPNS